MSSSTRWRVLSALAVLAAALAIALTMPARLGLDLRGGTQIVLQARDADAATTDRTIEVLRKRVDSLGVAEPTLVRSGENRIIVELPGLQDPEKAAEVIGRTAQLTVHPVTGVSGPQTDERGQPISLGPLVLKGEQIKGAESGKDPQGISNVVNLEFTSDGGKAWQKLTAEAACAPLGDPQRRAAIVLDDKVISSPSVNETVGCNAGIIGGNTQITGQFSQEEARDLAALIRGGALPVPVDTIEQRLVGPTLGAAAIEASAQAAIFGVALTALFLVFIYRMFGLLSALALTGYALISYACLVGLGATLTLPGLAGFVLAIGMAVDANVLIFERAREEFAASPRLDRAVQRGFDRSWSAILDSNVTTLIAAGLLFFLSTGTVRGFGITVTIGVLASMLAALVITRALVSVAADRRMGPKWTGIASLGRVREWLTRRNPPLMRYRRWWLAGCLVLVGVAIAGIAVRGLNVGVEFTGGRLLEFSTGKHIDAEAARQVVSDAGFPRAVVQSSDAGITVRTEQLSTEQVGTITKALGDAAGGAQRQRDELIGPSLGSELRTNALIALGVALLGQLIYLTIRFRRSFAFAAVLAMFQDVVLVVGLFAWLALPIDGLFLAAILTVIGYSVNDSVVVFDRIREKLAIRRVTGEKLTTLANTAVLETVPRTVNTGMGALFILLALTLLGGDSLGDFAIALLAGIGFGTLSTVFTATPLVIALENYLTQRKAGG
ncbi:protein translocase subunit SecD [Pseudonocardiaceae bacterium YIM PH 21723]|nr:protein translocase subunit SecD [Pseudonocardiaceae bacterium YIM PH 21723]